MVGGGVAGTFRPKKKTGARLDKNMAPGCPDRPPEMIDSSFREKLSWKLGREARSPPGGEGGAPSSLGGL